MFPDETKILGRLKKGDEKAFDLLFDYYYPPLCLFAKRYVADLDLSQEIVQGMFVKLWENRDNLDIISSFKAYLFTTVKNLCLDFLKHQKVEKKYHGYFINSFADGQVNYSDFLIENELQEKIILAIENLPDHCRDTFKYSRFEGLKYHEIAEKQGISQRAVEDRISKSLKILSEELKEYLPLVLISVPHIFKGL